MRFLVRLFIAAFALLLLLTTGLLFLPRHRDPAQPVMILDQGHINDNDWRLYWFVPELNYLRPFTAPLYDTRVIGWWHGWLYYSANTGWFEDTTGNQLRNIYRVHAGDHQPELVVGPVIIRGLKWLPNKNRIVYPAPIDVNRTDLFTFNLLDGTAQNITADLPTGMNVRRLPLDLSVDDQWVLFYSADLPQPTTYISRTDGTALVQAYGATPHSDQWSIISNLNTLWQLWNTGQMDRLPSSGPNQRVVAWLPDQNVLITQASHEIIVYSLTDAHILWRASGLYLAHSTEVVYLFKSDNQSVQIPLHGGPAETMMQDVPAIWGWTPDGHWLIYQDGNANMRRFDPLTHQTETIRPYTNAYIYNVGPSPDSQWWLFLESTPTNTALKRIRPAGRDEQQLLLLEGDATTPTTLFGTWTPPFQKHWQPLPLLVFALLLTLAPQLKTQIMRFF